MKEIKIMGAAAEIYGKEYRLDVKTQAEALRALDTNMPGFLAYMDEQRYRVVMISPSDPEAVHVLDNENKFNAWGDEIMVIIPPVDGDVIIEGIAIGLALTAGLTAGTLAFTIVVVVIEVVIMVAISAAISAIASAIMGSDQKPSSYEAPENKPSYLFNGVVNTMRQGGRIPLLYGGPMLIGSMTLSARIIVEEVPL